MLELWPRPILQDRMERHNGPLLDLSHASEIIAIILGSMPLRDRFNCALVCKAWAEAATAATRTVIVKHRVQKFSSLRDWLEKHGNRLEVLQLHECQRAALTALPCYANLQDLLLHSSCKGRCKLFATIASRAWTDIAAATRLTSLSVSCVQTTSLQADVVAALTALPNLEQLTWSHVHCSGNGQLSDSSLLQRVTRLTSLELEDVAAAALQHLGSLTKLQHLSIVDGEGWAAAGCPGLQELKALTSLKLNRNYLFDIPACATQLTALRQLDVSKASPTALNRLHVLTNLTQLCVWHLAGLSPESSPLKLPGLQHLQLVDTYPQATMPMSFLASCSQLQVLKLHRSALEGPGSLVTSTMLQHLELPHCKIVAINGAADPASWQQVFSGPGRLPHLTHLQLRPVQPALQQSDIDRLVECCSTLKVLRLETLQDSFAPTLARLPDLTHLHLFRVSAEDCGALGQLTGLRQLTVDDPWDLSAVGLRPLVALNQLTSLGFGGFCRSRNVVLDIWARYLMKDDPRDCDYALINKVCVVYGYMSPFVQAGGRAGVSMCVGWGCSGGDGEGGGVLYDGAVLPVTPCQ